MTLAPIILFTYNRLWHTKQAIEALQKNLYAEESELFIFSDGPKTSNDEPKVMEVREYLESIKGFKRLEIVKRDKNWGLANNIIDGVTRIVNEYGKVIVLEDDLVTGHGFIEFMNWGLDTYNDETRVASIHGYIYPIDDLPNLFFIRGADCWGWATWDRAWKIFESDGKKLLEELQRKNLQREADFNGSYGYTKMLKDQISGKIDSWAIRWYMSAFLRDMLTLYPGKSLVKNIGFEVNGTHCKTPDNSYDVKINDFVTYSKINVEEDIEAKKKIEFYFRSKNSLLKKIKNLVFR